MFIISIQLSASTKYLLARFYTAVLSLANAYTQKRANIYHLIFVDSRVLRLADYLRLADFLRLAYYLADCFWLADWLGQAD
jgi:hypothetical protein